jgi:hypothetical protein
MPKISALNSIEQLTTSSILPVVDNNVTQKVTLQRVVEFVSASIDVTFANEIELLQSASSITSSLNAFASASILSVATKLSTASFEAYTASVQTTNTSSLLLTSSFNTFTSSYKTDSGSFDSRVDNLELINVSPFLSASTFNIFTSSYTTHSSSFDNRLDIVEGINVSPFLSASTFNTYTSSNNSTNTTQNSRLNSLESNSGSYLLKSETGSFITEAETGSFLTSIPNGIISSSAQITAFGFISSSHTDITALNNFTTSIDSRVDGLEAATGSYLTSLNGAISGSGQITSLGFATTSSVVNVNTSSLLLTSSFNIYTASLVGAISSSTQITNLGFSITSSLAVVTPFLSSSIFNAFATSSNTFSSSINTFTSSANTALSNVYTATASLNTFTSSYTTHSSSFDSRINSIVNGSGFATTSSFNAYTASINTYSASINSYTSSMNSYTASINSTTASLNGKTGSYATTGSNQFKADQTITGSLTVTALTTISSSISANSSSVYLTSGSNLIVQNNGLVEITGSLVVSGSVNIVTTSPLQIGTGSGDEGGEILLAKAATNSTLSGSGITIDSYRDRLRIFEQGGDARGVYIDLSKAPIGVSGELTWKASGFVNAGTYVTLDNLKATLTSSGNRGLSIAAVSSNFTATYAGTFNNTGGAGGNSSNGTISVTTTPTTSLFGWNFAGQGDLSTFVLSDITNNRAYRITLQIGGSYLNNFIMIERLH